MTVKRDNWGSRMAFVLAASGSAIGLGNIWRFPTVAAQNGGGAFVQIYLIFIVLLGFIVMVGEISLGRNTQRNPVGAFRQLAPKSSWVAVGFLGIAAGWGILSYYSVVAGWTLSYIFTTAGGAFDSGVSAEKIDEIFLGTISNPAKALFWHFLFMTLTVGVVMGGVKQGIERWSKILMPVLFLLLLLLVVRSLTLENAHIGLKKYLYADWSRVNGHTFVAALGQAFFSLSLGMGTMITYGSYMHSKENIVRSAGWVCFSDTLIAVLAGLAIFPALYTMEGVQPEAGAKLIFIVLPGLFSQIPFGMLFGTGFFLLLSVAALTSSISLLEVPVAYFVDELKWTRRRATIVCGGIAFTLGIFSALSLGAVGGLTHIMDLGSRSLGFLDMMDLFFGQFSLTLGALLIALFVGWKWGRKALKNEISHSESGSRMGGFIAFQIRYVCPLVLIALLLYLVFNPNAFA
jgi:neurotransmitter:Na+ symporter, NSS family